jgi:hypothetical protein
LRNLLQDIFTQITTPISKEKVAIIVVMNLHRSCFHSHNDNLFEMKV